LKVTPGNTKDAKAKEPQDQVSGNVVKYADQSFLALALARDVIPLLASALTFPFISRFFRLKFLSFFFSARKSIPSRLSWKGYTRRYTTSAKDQERDPLIGALMEGSPRLIVRGKSGRRGL